MNDESRTIDEFANLATQMTRRLRLLRALGEQSIPGRPLHTTVTVWQDDGSTGPSNFTYEVELPADMLKELLRHTIARDGRVIRAEASETMAAVEAMAKAAVVGRP